MVTHGVAYPESGFSCHCGLPEPVLGLLQMYQFLSNTLLFTLDEPIRAGRVENRR